MIESKPTACMPSSQLGSFTTQILDDWMTQVDDSPAVIGKFKGLYHCVKILYNESFIEFFGAYFREYWYWYIITGL